MSLFGRLTEGQRIRKAARDSLTTAKFSTPVDCTPWVVTDVWPAELKTITPETAKLAEYLKRDLRRIADSANEKLKAISESAKSEGKRRAEEERVIGSARAFAAQRVESTIRHLRQHVLRSAAEPAIDEAPAELDVHQPRASEVQERHSPERVEREPPPAPAAVRPPALTEAFREPPPSETPQQRLQRLVSFVACQEPGLRWAAGEHEDGAIVLVTDLAHGWIPPGILLPDGVQLLPPGRRRGNAAAMLGTTTLKARYTPGDSFSAASEFDCPSSQRPRHVASVSDLGWKLGEATHWRDGLPRLVHTLAKAAGAGTGVVEAETDVLRWHLDTARYQLLAQYPDVDEALLLNCLLLATTEGMVTGDHVSANYHFAWFEAFSAPPPASRWNGTS